MSDLLSIEKALMHVLDAVSVVPDSQRVSLLEALGLVLAEPVVSSIDVPPADNSAMDGYALRADDSSASLVVSQRIPAGHPAQPLDIATAARIFTGAVIPPGADTVVMQEDCSEVNGKVSFSSAVHRNQNIRLRGQDVRAGETILPPGRVLRPQDLGLLASVGRSDVDVYRPLRVAMLSTGDELVEPGEGTFGEGEIYNSNRYTLAGLLRGLHMEPVDYGIIPDSPEATAEALIEAAQNADCVITTGGVSVGEEDHVKNQVERLGRLDLWKLAIKPGKPLAFGRIAETPFIGLPGNPSSVFVTFCLIARPFLMKRQGVDEPAAPSLQARALFTVRKAGRRQEYLRVTVEAASDGLRATRYANQSSGVLRSVSASNALAIIPAGRTVTEGELVDVLLLDLLA
ncbi:MAG: molybdopterin molybdotransferase MoeA [Halioglobus sp.]|nr:molybdopterin molybdotransferase MoeA [Halioglobus sp.]